MKRHNEGGAGISRRAMMELSGAAMGASILATATQAVAADAIDPSVKGFEGSLIKLGKFYRQAGANRMIDVDRNPGFGVKAATSEQAIERNLRIAQFYFTCFADIRRNGYPWRPDDYKGFASDASTHVIAYTKVPRTGSLRPAGGAPRTMPDGPYKGVPLIVLETMVSQNVFSEWGGVPDSFLAFPFVGGVIFSLEFACTSKATGKKMRFWEDNTFLINDEGRITHWECCSDTAGMNPVIAELTGGVDLHSVDFKEYGRLLAEHLEKTGGIPSFMTLTRPPIRP